MTTASLNCSALSFEILSFYLDNVIVLCSANIHHQSTLFINGHYSIFNYHCTALHLQTKQQTFIHIYLDIFIYFVGRRVQLFFKKFQFFYLVLAVPYLFIVGCLWKFGDGRTHFMWFVFLFFFVFVLLFAISCTVEAGRAAAIRYLDVFISLKQQYFHLLFGILSFILSHRMRAFECRKEKKKKRKAIICLFVLRRESLSFGHFFYFEDIVEEHLSKENVF